MYRQIVRDLGELLLEEGLVTGRQYMKALTHAQKAGDQVQDVLLAMGFVSEKEIAEVVGKRIGVEFIDLDDFEIEPELARSIPEHFAHRHSVIPVAMNGNRLTLAMVDPLDVIAIDDIRLITGMEIEAMISTEKAIKSAIDRYLGTNALAPVVDIPDDMVPLDIDSVEAAEQQDDEISLNEMHALVNEAPIVRMVNLIITQAINDKASDIHLIPERRSMRVKFRIDGVLHEVMQPPKHIQAPMVSRIKIMASLDIAERRVPQDGKIHLKQENREFDLRVSTIPSVHGERVVMRILDKTAVMLGLNKLGFYSDLQNPFENLVEKPYGMILVTGPTGSGKSTTLYSILNRLNRGEVNILTVEDPVEYQLEGIGQVQTNEKAGLTFSGALRAFLRQDPDIIMVGEIRDAETARIAIEAALTGHLVLSTLHTNDSAGAITRLVDMGVEPFLCASSVIGILAQRLARMICPNCRESYMPPVESVRRFGLTAYTDSEIAFYRGRGCDHCKATGYRGRTGIFELLIISDRIRNLILQRASSSEIRQCAMEEGMKTMPDDGLMKVLDGITTIEECLRVVYIEGQNF